MKKDVYRGDIWYIDAPKVRGSEQAGRRPGIVVSDDHINRGSTCVIVPLTTAPKRNLPTHAEIMSSLYPSTAICEQINTVSKERLTERIGRCTEDEMIALMRCMFYAFGLGCVLSYSQT